ncbi:Myosin-binding protein 7 [Ananas comosus]|uniref:Myosin-binding protein 7 n=1 Tax=Ananas comosus TaxID=4615 RepID=A0A199UI90_ANACO|nr:Myosin-binding protein 7 [Ananas comosus]
MAENEVVALREALRDQYLAMEKLYAELEEERKASASGADEALFMILRLQEEKAIEKMESSQYRRMAEEKIQHAEECVRILKDVIFQKQVEINSLKYQMRALKRKLLSICFRDSDFDEVNMFDYPWLRKSNFFSGRGGFGHIVRRNASLPALRLEELCSEIEFIDGYEKKVGEKYEESKLHVLSKKSNKTVNDWLQSKNIEEKIGSNSIVEINESRCDSRYSTVKVGMYKSSREASYLNSGAKCTKGLSELANFTNLEPESDDFVNSVDVQDKFEVPEILEESEGTSKELYLEAKNLIKVSYLKSQEDKTNLIRDQDRSANCHSGSADNETGNARLQNDLEKIKCHIQHVEEEVKRLRKNGFSRGKQQLDLLLELREKLDLITTQQQQQQQQQQIEEIKDSKSRKNTPQDNYLVTNFMEAMLSFWL